MRKLFTLFVVLLLGTGLHAQTPLTEAIDFTATDIHGTEWHLFDLLDNDEWVCIDFFFVACGPCQETAPKVSEAYTYFGCNTANITFLGIDTGDTDAEVEDFEETYGVLYPSISGVEGGGTQICNDYEIGAYPTVILIAPDHTIVEQDIWPIPTAQTIIDALESHGLTENECQYVGIPSTETETEISVYPNPAFDFLTVEINSSTHQTMEFVLYDMLGKNIKRVSVSETNDQGSKINIDLSDLKAGNYWLNTVSQGKRINTQKILITK